MARYLALATVGLLLLLAFASGADAQTETREIRGRVGLGAETITEAQWRELEEAVATGPEAFEKALREAFTQPAPPIVEVTACNAWTTCTAASNPDGTYVLRGLNTGIYAVSARTRSESGAVLDLVSPSYPVRVVENNAIVSLRVYPELVTIRGKVLDADGRPVASAQVTGSPTPIPETSEIPVIGDVTYQTGSDGSYELRGFPPVTSAYRIAGYLNGGSLRTQTDFSTYARIRVEADGLRPREGQVCEIPLITEAYLPAGRRFLKMMAHLQRSGETDLKGRIGEKEDVYLPASKGAAIVDVDVILVED